MATQNISLGIEWTDIKSGLSLADNQKYTFQNTGKFPLRIFEAASAPAVDAYGHTMEPGELLSITPGAGLNIYGRIIPKNVGESNVTVTEAA